MEKHQGKTPVLHYYAQSLFLTNYKNYSVHASLEHLQITNVANISIGRVQKTKKL